VHASWMVERAHTVSRGALDDGDAKAVQSVTCTLTRLPSGKCRV